MECQACGKPEGGKLKIELIVYRSYRLCYSCKLWWQSYEELFNRRIPFEEYKMGIGVIRSKSSINRERNKSIEELMATFRVSARTIYNALRS